MFLKSECITIYVIVYHKYRKVPFIVKKILCFLKMNEQQFMILFIVILLKSTFY